MKGWDDVSEKALKEEYRLLLNFIERGSEVHLIIKEIGSVRGASSGGNLKCAMSHVPLMWPSS